MRTALPALLLAVLLVTAGCAQLLGPDRPPSDQRALDAVNRSQAAVADVSSYRYTVDGYLEASKGDERIDADLAGAGVVDVDGERMNLTVTARDETREAYVAGDTVYTECARIGWGRTNLSGSTPWVEFTPAGEHLALLELTPVYWRGTDTVDGTETNVVVAYPTKEELTAAATDRGADVTDFRDANVRNATVTVWISRETDRPVQVRRDVKLRRGGASGTTTVTFRFGDYDEPVNVTRPSFDEEATWTHGCPGQ